MAEHKDIDIFQIRHNELMPEKGKILISEPFLQDVYFQRSVVLLVKHDGGGSMGFVLNKRTGLYVNDFFEGLENIPKIPIYMGGPVVPEHLFFIHSLGDVIPNSVEVADNIYFDGDFEALRYCLLSGMPIIGQVRFFLGYSGWMANQLNSEIKQNSWLVSDMRGVSIMKAEGESFWKYSVEHVGGMYNTWVNYPKNPILN